MVCRTRREDEDLRRAGRTGEGSWYLGRGVGRGVWWCAEGSCEQELGVAQVARALRASLEVRDVAALRALAASKRL